MVTFLSVIYNEDRIEIGADSSVFVRSRTEGLHGRSRVGGSATSLCQRAGCHQSRPWDLGEVVAGRCQRLLITLPPRSLKSLFASVALPAFVLGHDPTRKLTCVSSRHDTGQAPQAYLTRCLDPGPTVEHAGGVVGTFI